MPLRDRIGALAAWAVTMPARRFFFKRKDLRDVEFPSEDGVMLRGWLADVPNARGTVVIGHGYRDDRRQMLPLVPALAALGLRALLIDFRAHGRSGGSRITIGVEEALDVRASLAWARALGGPVSYVGFSMGAAAYLLGGVEAHAAVIDSPYDTLSEAIAVRGAFVRAPAGLLDAFRRAKEERCALIVEEIRPVEAASQLERPTLFVFARGDAWVGQQARERYRAAMSPSCEYVEVDGTHDDHFDTGWIVHVARFLERHAQG
jgi:pimeloyl-ACP methyl ester carboxylesterase